MSGMIGAWESLKNDHCPPTADTPTWLQFRESIDCYDQHLLETGVTLAAAIDRGDEVGAEWLANSFSHWYSQLEYRFEAGSGSLRDESAVHLDLMGEEWESVRSLLGVEDTNVFGLSGAGLVFAAGLKNLGDDRATLLCAVLVLWGRECACEVSLPAKVVKAFMFGAAAAGGSESIRAIDSLQSADALLVAFMRQLFSPGSAGDRYGNRADAAAAAIANIRRPLMVPGRVYTGSGRDEVGSFADGYLILLVVLAPTAWALPESVSERLRGMVREDNQLFQRVLRSIQLWIDRLGADDFSSYLSIYACLMLGRDISRDFAAARATVQSALAALLSQLQVDEQNAIASEPIDEARLREFGRWASERAFSQEAGRFPLPLFKAIDTTHSTLQEFALVLQAMEKGRFTVRAMAQRSVNEHEWIVKTFRDHVAVTVLRDRIHAMNPETRSVADPVEYWKVISQFSTNQATLGRDTILIVSGVRSPKWLRDWVGEGRDITSIPPNLKFTKRGDFENIDGYLGHFNDIGVFRAPVERGISYIIARDAFNSITFTESEDGARVWASYVPVEGRPDLVDIRLSWARDIPPPRAGGALRIDVTEAAHAQE